MNELIKTEDEPEMKDEYDFRDGVRGKYAERYAQIEAGKKLYSYFENSMTKNKGE